ncbi:uncharacterized protein DEA37_0014059, partial [Paragonimus westermani]
NMDNLLPLLEMGFEMCHLERAYMCGCRTVEDAVAYLAGDLSGSSTEKSPGRFVLRIPNDAAVACTSIFTPTRPFYVNLVDQHIAPVEKSEWALEESGSSQAPVISSYWDSDEAFAFQQDEAHRSAADVKSDRIARLRERELLLAEIQAEKESRRYVLVETLHRVYAVDKVFVSKLESTGYLRSAVFADGFRCQLVGLFPHPNGRFYHSRLMLVS